MKLIKEQLVEILKLLKKIDINITNSTSMSVDKIIDTINSASSNDIMNINNVSNMKRDITETGTRNNIINRNINILPRPNLEHSPVKKGF
jgi:hypothetical protein